MNIKDECIMIVLSSPSGSGKTTIAKKIQQKHQSFKISVSHTTRKPRPNELYGIDYFFFEKNEPFYIGVAVPPPWRWRCSRGNT